MISLLIKQEIVNFSPDCYISRMVKKTCVFLRAKLLFLQEAEIVALEAEIAQLQDPQRLLANGIVSPELEMLRAENAKLNFQIKHLERVKLLKLLSDTLKDFWLNQRICFLVDAQISHLSIVILQFIDK